MEEPSTRAIVWYRVNGVEVTRLEYERQRIMALATVGHVTERVRRA